MASAHSTTLLLSIQHCKTQARRSETSVAAAGNVMLMSSCSGQQPLRESTDVMSDDYRSVDIECQVANCYCS